MKILIIANAYYTISGGDVIFVELAKNWLKNNVVCKVLTNTKGLNFCNRYKLESKYIIKNNSDILDFLGIYIGNVSRIIYSVIQGLFILDKHQDKIFSASEFLPDILPALILKLKNKDIKWVAAFYVFAPNPFTKKYEGNFLRGLIYLITQKLSLILITKYADIVFTASKSDINYFLNKRKDIKAFAIRGGIDNKYIDDLAFDIKELEKNDAIFMGRLHPQKSILELVHIWKSICDMYPNLRLGIIGNGQEKHKLEVLINHLNLNNNVKLYGTLEGEKKFKVLKGAKMFISVSKLDSGNIALDETLACSVPGIIYDLEHLYYPKGVIKIKLESNEEVNKQNFINEIINLLNNEEYRLKLGKEAKEFAKELDWEIVSKRVLDYINIP